MDTKNKLRQTLIQRRKSISEQKQTDDSLAICKKLIALDQIKATDVIFCYAAKMPEVSLEHFLAWAWQKHKAVAFPRVAGDAMDFYYVTEPSQLQRGAFGILEPDLSCDIADGKAEVCLVPGVGFDTDGNRMGYGKGYYDRYFAEHEIAYKIGICFDEQIIDQIPSQEHDVRMDALVTATKMYHCKL